MLEDDHARPKDQTTKRPTKTSKPKGKRTTRPNCNTDQRKNKRNGGRLEMKRWMETEGTMQDESRGGGTGNEEG
jgi:hypothetical protein